SKRFFEQHYLPLLPYCFVASQVYRTNNAFLTYVETVISSLNFRETGLEEFVEMVTFYVINRLRHYREEQVIDRKSTRLNSSHVSISYAVFCLKKKKEMNTLVHKYTYKVLQPL